MKKIGRILITIIVVALLIGSFFLGRNLNKATNTPPDSFGPTPNLTAIAEWTPTPNAPYQAITLIKTAWPTPVTRIMPADREAFRLAFLEKLTAESINWSLLSNINHAGVAWRCTDIKLGDISLPNTTSGSLVAVWASWYGGLDNSTMQISVTDGTNSAPIDNVKNYSIDIYKNAVVTITFPDFGLVGPEIQQGNEVALAIDKPSILYGIWTTPREWLTGEDIIAQKQQDNVNAALDWAKVDSIAPLLPDGTRDSTYTDLLYDLASGSLDPSVKTVTLPNGDNVVLDHGIYDTLLATARDAAHKAGYADVESLKVVIVKPQSLNGFRLLANKSVTVVPSDIATQMANSTCPQTKLADDTLTGLNLAGLAQNAQDGILKRLLEINWSK